MNSSDDTSAAMHSGEQPAFARLVERHRRELQVHCYRLLGSLDDAEDLVQETFLRAWRRRETYAGRASLRAWLYAIATNACLDALAKRPKQAQAAPDQTFELPWLQACPDALLDAAVADAADEPDAVAIAKETIELAYLVAIQQLPPRTRAVLILRDVLDWSACDCAELLGISVNGVNSALQRARGTLKRQLGERRSDWQPATDPTAAQRALLDRYMEATERGDVQALKATLHEQARFAMPPEPGVWTGRDMCVDSWAAGGFGDPQRFGELRCLPTRANRQPAVACYLRRPGEQRFVALALDVLTIADGLVADILTFPLADRHESFGLPASL